MPTTRSGFMMQSTHGEVGNFELVVPSAAGGFIHCHRLNDIDAQPWEGPTAFGSAMASGVSLFQSPARGETPAYLEMIARAAEKLVYYCREDVAPFRWFGPFIVRTGVFGGAAMIETANGDFEIVAPLATGGLVQINRNNSDEAKPWTDVATFGVETGLVDGVALIQSNFGDPGNLEIVVNMRAGGANVLAHYWRDAAPGSTWNGPGIIGLGGLEPAPGSIPAMIQSRGPGRGNFEVVVPIRGGGLAHIARNNDSAGLEWSEPVVFGSGEATAVALFQSNFGTPELGNLEVAALIGNRVELYTRADQEPFEWAGPAVAGCAESFGDASKEGEWLVPYSSGVVGIHTAVLHTGKVLFFSYKGKTHAHGGGTIHDELSVGGEGDSSVLDPDTGALTKPLIEHNLFCAGQALMPDGRLLVAGGGGGGSIDSFHAFTPSGNGGTWKDMGLMTDKRWYPTVTPMPDGRMFVVSGTRVDGGPENGSNLNATFEIYDPVTDTHSAAVPLPFLNDATPFALFPFCYPLPNGKMMVHAGKMTNFVDLTTLTIDPATAPCLRQTPRTYRLQGTSVLLPLMPETNYAARVMVIGGGGDPPSHDTPATPTCEVLDLEAAPLEWKACGSMHHPRVMPDSVLLPDGTVLVMSGSSAGQADDGTHPVFPAELFDPVTDRWTLMANTRVPRLYHSTAVLLPDGRVLTAGKDEDFNPEPFKYPELRLEVFSPPYLFRGPRPQITAAPAAVAFGASFDVETPEAGSIVSACLIRPGATTHSFNMCQRFVGVRILDRADGRLTLEAPPNGFIAPPGFYMLFLLNGEKVPSAARFVKLG